MKVSELIAALQAMPQDAPVLIELVDQTSEPYLGEIDTPKLAWVDKHNGRPWTEQASDHEAVILK